MLKNTFIHIPGIGVKTEQRLWEYGIRDWDYLIGDIPLPVFYSSHQLLSPDMPVNPFKADLESLEGIRISHAYDLSNGRY